MNLNTVHCGDCLEWLPTLAENSVDSCVTDPPYELGFMGKHWDATGIAYNVELWRQVLRVLKPGAHLLSFGGSRTYHRMACAIEDAGFEIRDQIQWLYGSGFPKSLDVSKAIDKAAGVERNMGRRDRADRSQWRFEKTATPSAPPATAAALQWDGWGTALKPAHEPICVARKPLSEKTVAANVLKWGAGAINVDGCRVWTHDSRSRPPRTPNKIYGGGRGTNMTASQEHVQGRFPANVIHDGSEEVLAGFPETGKSSGGCGEASLYFKRNEHTVGWMRGPHAHMGGLGDSGSAARFFYCAKASKSERNAGCEALIRRECASKQQNSEERYDQSSASGTTGKRPPQPNASNHHPTVKPLSLMRYLCRLVTPPGGTVIEPFAGSGTTCVAAIQEGFSFMACEREEQYRAIALARILAAQNKLGLFAGVSA